MVGGINQAHMVTNISTATYSSVRYSDGLIIFTVNFGVDFHDVTVMFGIKPDTGTGLFSKFRAQNATFVARASNGLYLHAYSY